MFTNNSRGSENVRKVGLVILLASIALSFGNPVLARGGGEGHRGVGGGGPEKRGAAVFGHKSQKANENSNAQRSPGATRGQDRAALRKQNRGLGTGQAGHVNQRRNSK